MHRNDQREKLFKEEKKKSMKDDVCTKNNYKKVIRLRYRRKTKSLSKLECDNTGPLVMYLGVKTVVAEENA